MAMKEWKLDQNVEKMLSPKESDLLSSYRFAIAIDDGNGSQIAIGMLQDFQLQEARMNQPVSEIGSLLPKYLPGPFQGSISLSKVLLFEEGILSATHNDISGLEMDILSTFGKATDLYIYAFDPKTTSGADKNNLTGSSASIVGKAKIEKAKIQNKSLNISAGQPMVIESASFQFVKITDVPIS
jgi:hypothetical protein